MLRRCDRTSSASIRLTCRQRKQRLFSVQRKPRLHRRCLPSGGYGGSVIIGASGQSMITAPSQTTAGPMAADPLQARSQRGDHANVAPAASRTATGTSPPAAAFPRWPRQRQQLEGAAAHASIYHRRAEVEGSPASPGIRRGAGCRAAAPAPARQRRRLRWSSLRCRRSIAMEDGVSTTISADDARRSVRRARRAGC